ncbi:MAG: DUF362 domain-containing protein [Desulfobacterales bacterium]
MFRVYIESCKSYDDTDVMRAVSSIFAGMGGMSRFIRPGMKVVLKPNMILAKKPEEAATTHPEVVAAVASLVREAGGTPIIAESSFGQYSRGSLERHYANCGYKKLAEDGLVELNTDLSTSEVRLENGLKLNRINILTPLRDADLVISISKLKTHALMTYTGAVKNLFGAVAGLQKGSFHMRFPDSRTFADALIDICLAVGPGLHVMDAVTAMEGDGPSGGDPRDIGFIGASTDPYALDLAAASVITDKPQNLPTISRAIARGLGPCAGEVIEFPLRSPDSYFIPDFKFPKFNDNRAVSRLRNSTLLKPFPSFERKICIGCGECSRNCPASALKMVDRRPQLDISKCIRCFCCHEGCMYKAVRIKRSRFAGMLEAGLSAMSQVSTELFRRRRK